MKLANGLLLMFLQDLVSEPFLLNISHKGLHPNTVVQPPLHFSGNPAWNVIAPKPDCILLQVLD